MRIYSRNGNGNNNFKAKHIHNELSTINRKEKDTFASNTICMESGRSLISSWSTLIGRTVVDLIFNIAFTREVCIGVRILVRVGDIANIYMNVAFKQQQNLTSTQYIKQMN
uniref:Uncharacterized protein n=1 Tax=Glossina pallidipes TaxID=7398 RepID=A0A1A9ZUH0_GLOPL